MCKQWLYAINLPFAMTHKREENRKVKTKDRLRVSEIQGRLPVYGLKNRLGKNSSWVLTWSSTVQVNLMHLELKQKATILNFGQQNKKQRLSKCLSNAGNDCRENEEINSNLNILRLYCRGPCYYHSGQENEEEIWPCNWIGLSVRRKVFQKLTSFHENYLNYKCN